MTLRLTIIALLLTTLTAGAWTQQMLMREAYARRGAAVSAWTPSNTVTALWFNENSWQTTNSISVTNAIDLSGNGWNAKQSTVSKQPYITNAIAGKSVLYFDGGDALTRDNALQTTLFRNQSNGVIFAVVRPKPKATTSSIFSCSQGGGSSTRLQMFYVNTNVVQAGGRRLDADSYQSINVTNSAASDLVMLVVVAEYGRSNLQIRVNGTAYNGAFQTPGAVQNANSLYMSLGADYSGATPSFQGWFAEMFVTYSTNDITDGETYLRNRWGTP